MSKLLTTLELKVMNILWKQKKAFVKELLEVWDENPKPAYNTVSTTVRILQEKGFVNYKVFGRTHEYYPAITKAKYQKLFLKNAVENVFAGSTSTLITALVDNKSISDGDLEELKHLIEKSDD